MLARRIIPVILAKGQQAVKGQGFDSWRSVGQLRQAIRVYEMRMVDEVVLLDIAATPEGRGPNVDFVREFAGEFFCPVTVGGGVRTVEDFRKLLHAGADKVAINTAATDAGGLSLIQAAAKKFGSQAVVVSIDVRSKDRQPSVFSRGGSHDAGLDPCFWARAVETAGAGEILLNSVERDGTLSGYDLDLVESVSGAVGIPVIACGGAGSYKDLLKALKAGAHAVAASALWSFTDCTPAEAADYLANHGISVRTKRAA